jgi:hypothetical protein
MSDQCGPATGAMLGPRSPVCLCLTHCSWKKAGPFILLHRIQTLHRLKETKRIQSPKAMSMCVRVPPTFPESKRDICMFVRCKLTLRWITQWLLKCVWVNSCCEGRETLAWAGARMCKGKKMCKEPAQSKLDAALKDSFPLAGEYIFIYHCWTFAICLSLPPSRSEQDNCTIFQMVTILTANSSQLPSSL